jgi:hypothetical protein
VRASQTMSDDGSESDEPILQDTDVEITDICRAAYFDQGITFAPSTAGTILLGHGAETRWATSPLQYAGQLPTVSYRGINMPGRSIKPDRNVACGPNEFVSLWRPHPREPVAVQLAVCRTGSIDLEYVAPQTTVAVTAGPDDRFMLDTAMIADPTRRLIVVATAATCVVLRCRLETRGGATASGSRGADGGGGLDELWRTEELGALNLYPARSGYSHNYDTGNMCLRQGGAPLLLLAPRQPADSASGTACDGVVDVIAMQKYRVVFLRLGTQGQTAPQLLHAVALTQSPLGIDILRTWWPSNGAPPLLLLSRNRTLMALDVPDLPQPGAAFGSTIVSKARYAPMGLLGASHLGPNPGSSPPPTPPPTLP